MSSLLDPNEPIGALLLGAIFIVIGLLLTRLVRRLYQAALRHDRSDRIDQITLSFLSHLATLVVWLLLMTFYAHVIPALHRLGTALLTGVSLMSVIAGFAAQTTLGNLVAGISLVLYKPFRRGDWLQLQSPAGVQIGEVEDISLGYTVLKMEDERRIIIANGVMAQQTMIKLAPAPSQPAGTP